MADAINAVADEVNSILNERRQKEYFECIILLHSLIENLLKWLVFVKTIWDKTERLAEIPDEEFNSIRKYCNDLRYYDAQQVSLLVDVVGLKLYKRADKVRKGRNDMIHQLSMYTHRDGSEDLRKTLEELSLVANELVGIANKLAEETGVDQIWEYSLSKE